MDLYENLIVLRIFKAVELRCINVLEILSKDLTNSNYILLPLGREPHIAVRGAVLVTFSVPACCKLNCRWISLLVFRC
jgi:hypothetical protein